MATGYILRWFFFFTLSSYIYNTFKKRFYIFPFTRMEHITIRLSYYPADYRLSKEGIYNVLINNELPDVYIVYSGEKNTFEYN